MPTADAPNAARSGQIRNVPDVALHADLDGRAALDLMNEWLEANGMRSAYWYRAGTVIVHGQSIEAVEIVAREITASGWPTPTLVDGPDGERVELTATKTFPLVVDPPKALLAVEGEISVLTL